MSSESVHLPAGFTPTVAVGDTVRIGEVLAARNDASDSAVINIATELSIPLNKAGKAVKKNPGDTVIPGDIIASRAGFLGMGEQKIISSVTGTVISYDRRTGELTLRITGVDAEPDEVYKAPVAGKIVVCDNGEILIETEDTPDESAPVPVAAGEGITGELYYAEHTKETPVPLHLLAHDAVGKFVAGREFDREGLLKLIVLEVLGVVAITIKPEDRDYVAEKSSLPLLIVSEEEFGKIVKRAGKEVTLDPEQKKVVL